MFQVAKNIDTAFRQVRRFGITVILSCISLSVFTMFEAVRMVRDSERRIFILANGKALEAYAADRSDNIPVEARDHIKMFHHYFFSLDPDEKVVLANISKALYLADGSAKKQYDNLKESGYYTNLISGNISLHIEVDSMTVNLDSYPYYFKCLATEKLIRTSSVTTRSLVTEGWLRNVARSDNNSHGLLIERWAILENKDLKIENR